MPVSVKPEIDISAQPSMVKTEGNRKPKKGLSFSIETHTAIMIATCLSTSWFDKGLPSVIISTLLFLFLFLEGKKGMAKKLLTGYCIILILYVTMMHWGYRFTFLSGVHIYMFWKNYPGLIAAAALVSCPPGTISAFLSRLHCPKKLIVGVLVIFRFFPTTAAAVRRLKESLKNRGLMRFTQLIKSPIDSLEYLLVPVMMALIDSADRLSSSAVTRGAEAPTKRTSYYYQKQGAGDFLCLGISVLAIVSSGMWHFTGAIL